MCVCVQIVKHSETNLLFVKLGYTNKLNWNGGVTLPMELRLSTR